MATVQSEQEFKKESNKIRVIVIISNIFVAVVSAVNMACFRCHVNTKNHIYLTTVRSWIICLSHAMYDILICLSRSIS